MNAGNFLPSSPGKLVEALDARGQRGKAYVPGFLPPKLKWSAEMRLAQSAADQELARLDGIARQIDRPELLFANYLKREAVLSSAIEGTHTTFEDLVLFEASRQHRTNDDRHVENYVKALNYGRERVKEIPLGKRFFCELHKVLMQATDHERTTPGKTRDCLVFVGDPSFQSARFVPPPELFVDELLENLSNYIDDKEVEVPLVKLAVAHYQFEAIHPFRDGNGRVGRLLIVLWLYRKNILKAPMLYISAYFERNKGEYYDRLLNVSTNGSWDDWVVFFLRGVAEQSRDAWRRTQKLSDLRGQYKRRLNGPRVSASLYRLVDNLFDFPVISVPIAAEALGVTYAAAKSSVQKLIDIGILVAEPKQYGGTGYYIAGELLSLVNKNLDDEESP